jgi:hypothetical protein
MQVASTQHPLAHTLLPKYLQCIPSRRFLTQSALATHLLAFGRNNIGTLGAQHMSPVQSASPVHVASVGWKKRKDRHKVTATTVIAQQRFDIIIIIVVVVVVVVVDVE